jgi:hypothetical protein
MRFIFWLNLKGIKPVQEFIDKQSPRDIRKIKRKFKNVADFTLEELYRAGDVDDFKECRKNMDLPFMSLLLLNPVFLCDDR